MASLVDEIEERLKQGGWFLLRESKHKVYRHPNGATHIVPRRLSDTSKWRRIKPFDEIEAKEKDPMASGRNARIIPQEASVSEPQAPSLAPSPAEPCNKPQVQKERPWFEMISRQRQAIGKSRGEFAAALQWTTTQIKKLERGEYIPIREELADILGFLGIDPEDAAFIRAMKVRADSEGGIPKTLPKAPAPKVDLPPEALKPVAQDVEALKDAGIILPLPELPTNLLLSMQHNTTFPLQFTAEDRKTLGSTMDIARHHTGETVATFSKRMGITSGIFYSLKAGRTVSWEQCNTAYRNLRTLLAEMFNVPLPDAKEPVASPSPEPTVPDATTPRAETLAKAEKILRNPRLTDQEVQQLVGLLQTEAIKLLLGDMA